MELTEIDRDALRRAVAWGARYQRREPQIVIVPQPLPAEGSKEWVELAICLASMAQAFNLDLGPWQAEPAVTHDDGYTADCYARRPAEVALRRRMIAAGLSVFEPDPIAALERAQARKANGARAHNSDLAGKSPAADDERRGEEHPS